jgi:hypothetical protein
MELQWQQSSTTTWYCTHGKYFLKWKKIAGRNIYEVWKGEFLEYNTGSYWDFMKKVAGDCKAA